MSKNKNKKAAVETNTATQTPANQGVTSAPKTENRGAMGYLSTTLGELKEELGNNDGATVLVSLKWLKDRQKAAELLGQIRESSIKIPVRQPKPTTTKAVEQTQAVDMTVS
jgi:hypothetical protein